MLRGSDVGQLDAVEKRNARSMRALAGEGASLLRASRMDDFDAVREICRYLC
jgi:hypothetical protein